MKFMKEQITVTDFFNLLRSCVKLTTDKYENRVYYYYDKKTIRKNKLNSIIDINKKIKIDLTKINTNNLMFEQDLNNKILYVDYDHIWSKLESEYDLNYKETKEMIEGWLKDDTNWKQSLDCWSLKCSMLKDDTNWKQYSLSEVLISTTGVLKDDTNWKQYSPEWSFCLP